MKDKIRISADLGENIRETRIAAGIRTIEVAKRSGRSRDILSRLERGEDVTVSALLDILRAMGWTIRLERLGMPTLDEMRARFGPDSEAMDGSNG